MIGDRRARDSAAVNLRPSCARPSAADRVWAPSPLNSVTVHTDPRTDAHWGAGAKAAAGNAGTTSAGDPRGRRLTRSRRGGFADPALDPQRGRERRGSRRRGRRLATRADARAARARSRAALRSRRARRAVVARGRGSRVRAVAAARAGSSGRRRARGPAPRRGGVRDPTPRSGGSVRGSHGARGGPGEGHPLHGDRGSRRFVGLGLARPARRARARQRGARDPRPSRLRGDRRRRAAVRARPLEPEGRSLAGLVAGAAPSRPMLPPPGEAPPAAPGEADLTLQASDDVAIRVLAGRLASRVHISSSAGLDAVSHAQRPEPGAARQHGGPRAAAARRCCACAVSRRRRSRTRCSTTSSVPRTPSACCCCPSTAKARCTDSSTAACAGRSSPGRLARGCAAAVDAQPGARARPLAQHRAARVRAAGGRGLCGAARALGHVRRGRAAAARGDDAKGAGAAKRAERAVARAAALRHRTASGARSSRRAARAGARGRRRSPTTSATASRTTRACRSTPGRGCSAGARGGSSARRLAYQAPGGATELREALCRLPRARARRGLRAGADRDRARLAAGDRPRAAAARRSRRPRRARGAALHRLHAVREGGGRGARAGAGRRPGSLHGRARRDPRREARVRHPVAPVPRGRGHVAAAAARAARLGRAHRRLRARGRLRRRVPLRRKADRVSAGARPRRAGDLRRHRVEAAVPGAADRLAGRARAARAAVPERQGAGRHRHAVARAARAGRLHRGGTPRAPRTPRADPDRGAARGAARRGRERARRARAGARGERGPARPARAARARRAPHGAAPRGVPAARGGGLLGRALLRAPALRGSSSCSATRRSTRSGSARASGACAARSTRSEPAE